MCTVLTYRLKEKSWQYLPKEHASLEENQIIKSLLSSLSLVQAVDINLNQLKRELKQA